MFPNATWSLREGKNVLVAVTPFHLFILKLEYLNFHYFKGFRNVRKSIETSGDISILWPLKFMSLRIRSPKSLAEWSWVHSRGFQISDSQRMRWFPDGLHYFLPISPFVVALTQFHLFIFLFFFLFFPPNFAGFWRLTQDTYGSQAYMRVHGGIWTSKKQAPVAFWPVQRSGEREVCFYNV